MRNKQEDLESLVQEYKYDLIEKEFQRGKIGNFYYHWETNSAKYGASEKILSCVVDNFLLQNRGGRN